MTSGDLEISTKIYVYYYLCMICPNHNLFQLGSDDMFMHLRVRIKEHNIRAFPGAIACSHLHLLACWNIFQIASCLPATMRPLTSLFRKTSILDDFGGFILIVDRAR